MAVESPWEGHGGITEPVSLQDDDESARTVYYRDPYYLRLEAFVAAGGFDRDKRQHLP